MTRDRSRAWWRPCEGAPKPSYLFFWGHRASGERAVGKWCLSQWWPVAFTVDGVTYATAMGLITWSAFLRRRDKW